MARIDIKSTGTTLSDGVLQLENGVAMDATLRKVADQNNTTSPLLLSTTLVQTTSTLKITTADNPYIDAEDNSGNNRFTVGRDPSSQQVNVDFASNPTGSTTAVGAIRTYRDGVNLSEAMTFIEDGSVGIGTSAPVGLLDLYKAAAATRLAIRGDAGQNRLISYRTGAVQRFGLYVNNTAESGSNAGSNFAIRAYNDAGTLLTTPFFINRATGNVGILNTNPLFALDVNGTINAGFAFNQGSANANTIAGIINQGGASQAVNGINCIRLNAQLSAMVGAAQNPTATLHVKGSGSTSATTSLLVQTSSGSEALKVTDDRSVTISGGTTTISSPKTFINSISMTTAGFGDTGYGMAIDAGFRWGVNAGNSYKFGHWASFNNANNWNTNSASVIEVGLGATTPNVNDITWTSVNITPTFNVDFVGRVGNIVRGIYYNPIITSFVNGVSNQLRAFQSVVGGVFINTSNVEASAILQADSTTQGFLPPRMTTAEKNAIVTPAAGLMVYDTTLNKLCVYTTAWETITSL